MRCDRGAIAQLGPAGAFKLKITLLPEKLIEQESQRSVIWQVIGATVLFF